MPNYKCPYPSTRWTVFKDRSLGPGWFVKHYRYGVGTLKRTTRKTIYLPEMYHAIRGAWLTVEFPNGVIRELWVDEINRTKKGNNNETQMEDGL